MWFSSSYGVALSPYLFGAGHEESADAKPGNLFAEREVGTDEKQENLLSRSDRDLDDRRTDRPRMRKTESRIAESNSSVAAKLWWHSQSRKPVDT